MSKAFRRKCRSGARRSCARWVLGGALLSLAFPLPAHPQNADFRAKPADPREELADPRVGVVYAEGNVGTAIGGHVALIVDGVAHHHQQSDGGIFRRVRQPWDAFRFKYGVLQNRPLHVAWLTLAPADADAIGDALAGEFLAQRQLLTASRSRQRDRELAEALAGEGPGPQVAAAGLLSAERAGDHHALALRAALVRRLESGGESLPAQLGRASRVLAQDVAALQSVSPEKATQSLEALRRQLLDWTALRALEEAWGLAPDARVDPAAANGGNPPLSKAEREGLQRWSRAFEDQVLAFLQTPGSGRGDALLRAAARYQAVASSLEADRPLFLDPFPDETARILPDAVVMRNEELSALARSSGRAYREGRSAVLAAAQPDASAWSQLETAAARATEYALGARQGWAVREIQGTRWVPSRSRRMAPPALPASLAGAREIVEHARRAEASADERVRRESPYQLVRDNCVTALVEDLIAPFAGREERVRALGGNLEPGERLGFIPFVMFQQVRDRLRVARVEDLPNQRSRLLAALRPVEGSWRVGLRESNTWTATGYRHRDRDGAFLFFTDGVFWRRPLYGAVNLTLGLADAGVGLVAAPFDRAARLRRAGRGILFSLPELVFWNVRKGSYDAATLEQLARLAPLASEARAQPRARPGG